jgi:serine/threonine-protein kinase SRPK3
MLRIQSLNPVSIEDALSNYEVLQPGDIAPAAAFIRACIKLDPKERPTADELCNHDWIAGVDWSRDYRPPG